MKNWMVAVVGILALLLSACAATQPAEKPTELAITKPVEKLVMLKGQIDFVKEVEIFSANDNETTMVTLLGFNSGEGAIVSGIHPGIREGKKVRIYLKAKITTYKGTLVYEINRIEPILD